MGWILIVEDEDVIGEVLQKMFMKSGLKALVCRDYEGAISEIDRLNALHKADLDKSINHIDVVICDLLKKSVNENVKDCEGLELMKYLNRVSQDTFSIIYTGYGPELVAIYCIGLVDAYWQKTNRAGHMNQYRATMEELVSFVIRHLEIKNDSQISSVRGIRIDHLYKKVSVDGVDIELSSSEIDVLELLIRNKDYFITYDEIISMLHTEIEMNDDEKIAFVNRFVKRLERRIGKNKINIDPDDGIWISSERTYDGIRK